MYQDKELENLIDLSLAEDIRTGDITTLACIYEATSVLGRMTLKQTGVVAGLPMLKTLFNKIDAGIEFISLVEEGSFQKTGTVIAKVSGPARGILTGERTALNLIQHASGVATATAAYVRKVGGYQCEILDTRKTLPGLRALEKYAVRMGGGKNHRFGLDDRFIIKSSHLSFIAERTDKPIAEAVKSVQNYGPGLPIEIEIDDLKLLDEALQSPARAIMLNNLPLDEVSKCVGKIRKAGKKVYLESSGTITLETVRAYAETGVDGISIGALTHSVQDLDISMRLM